MNNFIFNMPTRVLFGAGQLNHLHEESLPGKKALIVTSNGQSTKKYGYLSRVQKELELAGVEHCLFDEIRPNPTRKNVMDGAKAVRDNGCDFVVALGGGSVMDCSKCIALMAANPGDIWDYSLSKAGGKKNAEFDALPIICITTSAGTGSEVDIAAVISDDELKEKTGIFFPSMFPTLSAVDADLMMSVPPRNLLLIRGWIRSSMPLKASSIKISILWGKCLRSRRLNWLQNICLLHIRTEATRKPVRTWRWQIHWPLTICSVPLLTPLSMLWEVIIKIWYTGPALL